jgi:8-oxo-dGTP diphosphatase
MNGVPGNNSLLSVDVVIFGLRSGQLQLLLVCNDPGGTIWSLPGHSLSPGISLEETASQELERQLGSRDAYLEQLYTYGEPGRSPGQREVAVVYFALLPADTCSSISPFQTAGLTRWFSLNSLPRLVMDHEEIIRYALRRLRYKLEYSAVGFQLLPEEFTLSELQQTYETILGEKLDKRNFRRRILEAGIIEQSPFFRTGEGRPARLFRYRSDAVAEVKARRLFP